jgi:hypothetical protein
MSSTRIDFEKLCQKAMQDEPEKIAKNREEVLVIRDPYHKELAEVKSEVSCCVNDNSEGTLEFQLENT